MSLITKLFGTYSDHQLKKIKKTADAVEALAETYRAMSDDELRNTTAKLRSRLDDGASLDDVLPDAFAAVRETADRVLGKRPFYVQILGAVVLHQGRIAEMKTGEGKTLVATMPAYLNALTGNGVHIVTVNEYLAKCGADEMGRVYSFLGMTTGLVIHNQTQEQKRAAYNADITYGTNNEFGFDYLRDNMVIYREKMVQRGHSFAIVDEVDSILIDEARTPLIISGAGEASDELYKKADDFVRTLKAFVVKETDAKADLDAIDADYIVEEKNKNVTLTASGAAKAEHFFGIDNYTDGANATIAHHVNQALKAHGTMKRDDDYVVNEQGVMIVDSFTGRLMPGRRYSDGLHQAIEAKEGVEVQKENKTLATITFQNYFRMYAKLSGMTGTALTEETEFREIYGLDVIEIPTNMPMIRIDHPDCVYKNVEGKYRAIIEQVKTCHAKGQPVLVGTISIDKSEELSRRLKKEGIIHTVLNAKYHEKEAEIVAQAGKLGAVTISTNMAGRGTDIMLGGNPEFLAKTEMKKNGFSDELIASAYGTFETDDTAILDARKIFADLCVKYKVEIAPEAEKVRAAGGLFILGTERHESRRIDNQLRGRSGRQGDPGESKFFLSLQDDLMRLFGSDRIIGIIDKLGLDDNTPIDARLLSNSIETAQKHIEDQNFKRRRYVLSYDDVMNQQRNIIYEQRRQVLDGEDISDTIKKMIASCIREAVVSCYPEDGEPNPDGILTRFRGVIINDANLSSFNSVLATEDKKAVEDELGSLAEARLLEKIDLFGEEQFAEVQRAILLQNVDRAWMAHIDAMDDLKDSVGTMSYTGRDPITEYRMQGADMFESMVGDIRENTVRMVLTVVPKAQPVARVQVAKNLSEGFEGQNESGKKKIIINAPRKIVKVGRNDPCPCGSGKKFKKCCGANIPGVNDGKD